MSKRLAVSCAAVTFVLLAPSACSSGSPTDAQTTDSHSSAATAIVDAATAKPTNLGVQGALSRRPDPGKHIVGVVAGTPTGVLQGKSLAAATAALGWDYKTVTTAAAPEAQQQAFESALALKPDGIFTAGASRDVLSSQLTQAEKQGVAVVMFASTDKPGGAVVSTDIAAVPTLTRAGNVSAANAIVSTNGQAHVALFQLAGYPILDAYQSAVAATLKELCPGCTLKVVQQQATDIGTNTPAAVVSTVQADPEINWVLFSLGSQSTGVAPALASAGLEAKVSIGGVNPTTANFKAVKDGVETAWVGSPIVLGAWMAVHDFALKFNGDPMRPTPTLPEQLILKTNINDIAFDADGQYLGFADYQAAFKKLWNVG